MSTSLISGKAEDLILPAKARIYFVLWLAQNAKQYFGSFGSHAAAHNWIDRKARPFVEKAVGNGSILDDAPDSVLLRTMVAVNDLYWGRGGGEGDPINTALGKDNNAATHFLSGSIGLAEIPRLYEKQFFTGHRLRGLVRTALKNQGVRNPSLDDYQTSGGVPWKESDGLPGFSYDLDESYELPLVIEALMQALMRKDLSEEALAAIQAGTRVPTTDRALVDFCDVVTASLVYLNDLPKDHKAALRDRLQKLKNALEA